MLMDGSMTPLPKAKALPRHGGRPLAPIDRLRWGVLTGLAAMSGMIATAAAQTPSLPRLFTHESYVEEVLRTSTLRVEDPKAVFAYVLNSLPERVKIYPTENYYYFRFVHNGSQFAGNIRLDADTRDHGKVHIAYSIDFAEWKDEDPAYHLLLGQQDGVKVEKLDRLAYRVTYGPKSVVFELNDLSKVVPPPGAIGPDEKYIGPVFDDSAVRFFLVFNQKLKFFLYILDETIPPTDTYNRALATDRILIGKRTGFAFYRDHRLDRKILVGVFEGNARVNSYFDGPFDQLPDNFIEGETLRDAILEMEPSLRGKIDRFGSSPDGATRFMIGPYLHYRSEEELTVFHTCAEDKKLPANLYYACFLIEPDYGEQASEPERTKKPHKKSTNSRRTVKAETHSRHR
jgi:hypothetical protein